ncbi:sugar ABC transporter ATP-binding protein [Streptomyces sp. NPDC005799]|uniref:sugar ABC transporter ATP-binding protein n=1 Tax=Streptomyces sp. NPDC005799 TaxID=3154678 RepID=UPI0033D94AF4
MTTAGAPRAAQAGRQVSARPTSEPETMRVEATGITKSFGATQALASGTLRLAPGEVHTVIGENGSGKSTLVKILSGVHTMDGGTLAVDGTPIGRITSPRRARDLGIATVFQEVLTVASRSVLDNIWLGTDGVIRQTVPKAERRRGAEEILRRLAVTPIDLDVPAAELSLSQRQLCCIARALVTDPRVLILDESTSALDLDSRDRLFEVVRELTATGTSVLFISHRMDEIFKITDVITVFRSGTTVAERIPVAQSSIPDLIGHMTGGEVREAGAEAEAEAEAAREFGPVVLEAEQVRLTPTAAPVDLAVRAGELVGLVGLEGQGQDHFLHALRGIPAPSGTVSRVQDETRRRVTGPVHAYKNGIVYVPRERRGEALLEHLSIRENFALPTLRRDTWGGLVRPTRTLARLRSHARRLRLAMRSHGDAISTLSGGNQQKVVIARWLASDPAVLLLNDPTRGVDLKAKRDLYAVLRGLCAEGLAVVMLSSEVDELLELMDRVVVFRESAVVAEIPRSSLSRSALVGAYFGHKDHTDA